MAINPNKIQFMIKLNKTNTFNAIYILYMISLLATFIKQFFFTNYNYNYWGISEYLINYQAGFVRRGLLGEILFFFAKNFHINVVWTIEAISFITFAILLVFFIKSFIKKGYTLYVLPLCFSLGMLVYSGVWLRKDSLMFLFFIAVLWIWHSRKSIPIAVKLLLINILSVFIILTHEVFAIFTLPILFLILFSYFRKHNTYRAVFMACGSLLPCIIVFTVAALAHGNQNMAQAIWDSWQMIANQPTPIEIGNSIVALGWTPEYAFKFHSTTNFLAEDIQVISVVFWCMAFPVVYYIVTSMFSVFKRQNTVFTEQHKVIFSTLFMFQLLVLLPLFTVLSIDYGRIFCYATTTTFVTFLFVPLDALERMFPDKFISIVQKINSTFCSILPPSKTTLAFLILMVAVPSWGFTWELVLKSNMLGRIMMLISQPLIIFKGMLL